MTTIEGVVAANVLVALLVNGDDGAVGRGGTRVEFSALAVRISDEASLELDLDDVAMMSWAAGAELVFVTKVSLDSGGFS